MPMEMTPLLLMSQLRLVSASHFDIERRGAARHVCEKSSLLKKNTTIDCSTVCFIVVFYLLRQSYIILCALQSAFSRSFHYRYTRPVRWSGCCGPTTSRDSL